MQDDEKHANLLHVGFQALMPKFAYLIAFELICADVMYILYGMS
nr:hypothetical protein [uncultured Undibacterium sp.]